MSMKKMKVSVITPSFNSAATIARCIDSVKAQTYPNIEHIVIDGGSTDGTVELLHKAGVHCLSESDSGIYHAMNKGVRIATGEIIHILNSDDWYSANDIVSTMVDLMESGKYDVCHAYVAQVTAQGEEVCVIGADAGKSQLLNKMKVAHPSCFVRSSVYQRFGDYSQGFNISADHDFILRLWPRVKVGFLAKVIVQMQWGGMSNSNPLKSYKESMAVALVHGKGVMPALIRFCYECVKHFISMPLRKLRRLSKKTLPRVM
jgi:glycosyltransferase involved in cell wall biosynthesis